MHRKYGRARARQRTIDVVVREVGGLKQFWWLILFVALSAAASIVALKVNAANTPTALRCGGALWPLKTFSDPQRKTVNLSPEATTIGAILERRGPNVAPTRRRTAFQRQNWEVVAQVVSFRLRGNEVQLDLFDHGKYMHALLPSPSCLSSRTRARAAIVAARHEFTSRCGDPTGDPQSLGAVGYVTGVGFWNGHSTDRGAAPNGAELHPVTGFRSLVGCRS